jgi:hypothetical protein
MSKKKLNTEGVLNELHGSVFFPQRNDTVPSKEATEEEQQKTQEPRKLESQEPRKQVSQETGNPGTQETGKRANYPKATFNLHPDVIYGLADTKEALRRRFNIKATKEEIVELAVRWLCEDFEKNQETSFLVSKFPRNPENK